MAIDIQGAPRRAPMIEVSALFGRFQIPGSDFVVRFASTFANAQTGGHRELLSQLKPMRDRVEASALQDLTALLQRDLNDKRVAKELIPYLLGQGTTSAGGIGFFPAVLAVLIPKHYLEQADEQAVPYPVARAGEHGEGGIVYSRPGVDAPAWEVVQYRAGDEIQPLGLLKVNPHQCEIVVLDGQHRSNAFRFLAGDFNPSTEIYGEFYREVQAPPTMEADLPVTVVWFEALADAQIKPRLISRQLFVDVNNSAHAVSLARTILLDDRSVSAIATQEFYNQSAQQRFEAERFSLLHGAFDVDSDLANSSLPAFALTSPEIVEAAFYWLLLGSASYSNLSEWRVQRMRAQRNRNRFVQVMGSAANVRFGTDDDESRVEIQRADEADAMRAEMRRRIVPVLLGLMQGITLVGAHYRAAASVRDWVAREGDTTINLAWNKIFLGGEGLYWTFSDRRPQQERNMYSVAMHEIEKRFRDERATILGKTVAQTDAVFKSFATKAFQTGYVMAALSLAEQGRGEGNVIAAAEELLANLNRYTPENWVAVFLDVRPLLFRGDLNPKLWPGYRNLLVRMFLEGDETVITNVDELPEWKALENVLKERAAQIADADDYDPDTVDHARTVRRERDVVLNAFGKAGMRSPWFASDASVERGSQYLREELSRV